MTERERERRDLEPWPEWLTEVDVEEALGALYEWWRSSSASASAMVGGGLRLRPRFLRLRRRDADTWAPESFSLRFEVVEGVVEVIDGCVDERNMLLLTDRVRRVLKMLFVFEAGAGLEV